MNDRMIAARVIARLKVMYPAYARMMDNDSDMMELALDEWATSLNGVTMENIAKGFEKLRDEGSSYCPSIPEFVGYCGGKPKPWWATWTGIIDRGAQLGLDEKKFVYKHEFVDLVRKTARDTGELVPLSNEEEKRKKKNEALPGGVVELTRGMKVV